jgi:hypothetical protein
MNQNENYPICEFCGGAIPQDCNYCPSCGEDVPFFRNKDLYKPPEMPNALDDKREIEKGERPKFIWQYQTPDVSTGTSYNPSILSGTQTIVHFPTTHDPMVGTGDILDLINNDSDRLIDLIKDRKHFSWTDLLPDEEKMTLEEIAQLASEFDLLDEVVEAVKTGEFKPLIDKLKMLNQQMKSKDQKRIEWVPY